jgi:DNA repair protein RecO (recombination protein O)
VRALSDASALPAALRAFELLLLRHLGWLPNLALDGVRQCPVDPAKPYALQAQWGLVPVASGDPAAWPGACWLRLQQALEAPAPWVALMAQPADLAHSALRLGLAALLHYHSGVRAFRVRELLRALKRLQPRAAASATEVMP